MLYRLLPPAGLLLIQFSLTTLPTHAQPPQFPPPQACPAPPDTHTQVIHVNPAQDLAQIAGAAPAGAAILLANGTYRLTKPIYLRKDGVTLRSASGKRDSVILDGNTGGLPLNPTKFTNELINVAASKVTLASITLRYARHHAIHAVGASNRDVEDLMLHDLRVYDCGEQLIKVNSNGAAPYYWVDRSTLQCSVLEFVDNSVMSDKGSYFYTGGFDMHGGRDWVVRWNLFRNIQREGKLMEHAMHAWYKPRGTLVENNIFLDCYRAIGLGMNVQPRAIERRYADKVGNTPHLDHIGGIIRNNLIYNRAGIKLETGIELMNAAEVEVYHNTVLSVDKPFNSMEYRWPNTRTIIRNNIFSHQMMARDGAQAVKGKNLEFAPLSLFRDPGKLDFRLRNEATQAKGQGENLSIQLAGVDLTGVRVPDKPDLGVYQSSTVSSTHAPLMPSAGKETSIGKRRNAKGALESNPGPETRPAARKIIQPLFPEDPAKPK